MNVKDINDVFLNPTFIVQLLGLLNKYELLDDISLRNALIRKEWIESKQKGELNKDFMERMANKFYLSAKTIDSILYANGNKKKGNYSPEISKINNEVLNEIVKNKIEDAI